MAASSRLSAGLSLRARESARLRRDRELKVESLEPRLALATGLLSTLVSVVRDDQGSSLLPRGATAEITEGQQLAASVRLTSRPDSPMLVSFKSLAPPEVGATATHLRFTEANWNQPQAITLHALQDNVRDGDSLVPVQMTTAIERRPQLRATRNIWAESLDSRVAAAAAAAPGDLDTTFRNLNAGQMWSVAVQADGKILIGGLFNSVGGQVGGVARLNADGTPDSTTFNPPSVNGDVYSVVVQADGKILICGDFTTVDGQARSGVARLFTDGTLDTTFGDPNVTLVQLSGLLVSLAVQADGKILIGGVFTAVDGVVNIGVARLNADGTLDTDFDWCFIGNTASSLPLGGVFSLAVQADGKILIGGHFNFVNNQVRRHVARLNADGTLDNTTFTSPNVNGDVYSVVVQADGKILIGGGFTTVDGQARNGVARLNADGTLDTTFGNPSANALVWPVTVQADGKILIGGWFTTVGGQARNGVARLNADGTLDTTFGNPNANAAVRSVAVQADGKILIGGEFTTVDGQARLGVARLWGQTAPSVTELNKTKGSVNGGTVVTISGTGFNNTSTVKFGTVAATNVTYNPATGGSPATLTATSPAQTAGTVDVTVTTGASTSPIVLKDQFTYVATSTPIVHPSTAPLPADAVTLTISGEHFSPTNTVTLSSGTAIVQSATATSITLLFTRRPTAGPLTATVTTSGASSGAVQVATVHATVTPTTATVAASGKTLVITGTGFDATRRANNIVTLSSGAGVVTKATATSLTISLTSPPQLGPLTVTSLRVRGVESDGLPVQVATVVPGPASARSTVTASVAEAAVGTPVTVTLQAIDAVGNPVTTGGARVRFTASSTGTFSRVTDNGNGSYTATFTTMRVGAQVFSATVNGVKGTDTATTAFVFQSQFSRPIPGPNWSVARGPGFLVFLNTAIPTGPNSNVALYKGAAASDLTVTANVENLKNGQFGGVVARYSSKTSYYQAGLLLESGTYYAVIQAVGVTGVRTLAKELVEGVGAGLVSFRLNGNSLSLSLNGFQVAQATDSRFQSGSVGISGGNSVGFTNFFAG